MSTEIVDAGQFLHVVSFAAVPVVAAIGGAAIAAFRRPGAVMRSHLQHLAAGVVFSVVAVEILPDVIHRQHPWLLVIGFSLGVALMLALEWFAARSEGGDSGAERSSAHTALFASLGIDVFLDGLLIAISFNAGAKAGQLLTVALAVELLSTGLALSATLGSAGMKPARIVAKSAAVFALIVVGAAVGAWFSPYLAGDLLDLILAFGLAALLFLVTEQLLVEAHREPETPLSTALFFVGFLVFLLLGMEAA
jgi:ZIP family zinc transporter